MTVYIDCSSKAFTTVAPSLENRLVIEQNLPAALPMDVVVGILTAIRQQAMAGVDLVYKINID